MDKPLKNVPGSVWTGWLEHPQRRPLRRALFQIHLWSDIGIGLYIFFISVTGSVLVYRNELYMWVTPEPYISEAPGPVLSERDLRQAIQNKYPTHNLVRISPHYNQKNATVVWLSKDGKTIERLFDPVTGEDVGKAVSTGVMLVSGLIDIHDNFLAGRSGQIINGIGAMAVVLVAMTGLVIWWPGRKRWRRSVSLKRGVGWKRFTWDLHSMMGFWSFLFILVFAVSGIYLCFPETFHAWADRTFALDNANPGERLVDKALYWLAFSHFGRINGIGLFCEGPGLCDQTVKAVWAFFGLAPAAMFVTGTIMWWNRVVRRWIKQ